MFVHEYFGLDQHIVWDIVQKDLPELKETVAEMLGIFE
jgi:uncharacterized protein with HEPN domain